MTKIDEIARALSEEIDGPDRSFPLFEPAFYETLAKAAVKILQHPSPWMRSRGDQIIPSGFHWGIEGKDISGTQMIYEAMVAAILEEAESANSQS